MIRNPSPNASQRSPRQKKPHRSRPCATPGEDKADLKQPMTKIIRTKTRAEGGITPEEKIKLDEHAKKWIDIIMRTEPINPEKIIPAIKKLYEVSGLKEPRVIIVPSPFIGRLASGLAASILYLRKNGIPATFGATDAATFGATDEAVRAAVREATRSAAVREATDDAAFAATSAATEAATRDATR